MCSGLDSILRGYETHTRHLFDSLAPIYAQRGDSLTLFKRDGAAKRDEVVLPVLDRDSSVVRALTEVRSLQKIRYVLDGGSRYYWEHLFFSGRFVAWCAVNQARFDRILSIEPMVATHVHKARRLLPGSPRFVFTHGFSLPPRHYLHITDRVHEVSIENYERAREAGCAPDKLRLIPHFLPDVPAPRETRAEIRRSLGVVTERAIVSVGVIERGIKRMDYLIEEAARLGPEWSLVLAGPVEAPDLIELARARLGPRFVHHVLSRDQIDRAYRAADLFVLGSLGEGFGIVILEAMRAGVPVLVHDRPLFRWVVKDPAQCADLREPGAVARFAETLTPDRVARIGAKNRETFLANYAFDAVRESYDRLIMDPFPR